jgi:LacI family transcriptional regulator
VINHGEGTVVEALRRARPAPAAFLGYAGAEGELSDWLRDWGGPAVNIGGRHRPPGMVSVVHDDEAIGRMAAEHLLEARERRYAFLGMGRDRISEGRFHGFREHLLEAGLPEPDRSNSQGEELDDWIRALPRPAALFCGDDLRARAAAQRAERFGIQVPGEFSILGVDNDPFECEMTRIPLSSIQLRFEELGRRAAETAWELYRGNGPGQEEIRVLPSHVEVRLSTDYLAVEDGVVRVAMRTLRQWKEGGWTVAELAETVGVSRRVLEKRFRKAAGRTVFDEIHRERMERARHLVEETNLPVEHISERIGLADHRRFVRLFKERYGATPFAYRRQGRSGEKGQRAEI